MPSIACCTSAGGGRLGDLAVALGNPLAGFLLGAHRQLHAGDAVLAPDDAAGADHGLEDCKMLAGHGSLQMFPDIVASAHA
ncbi:hypothetical protein ACVMB0_002649 [Bradyrhizobium sp. USDA 4451]